MTEFLSLSFEARLKFKISKSDSEIREKERPITSMFQPDNDE